jgi:hypothetical protein
VSLRWRERIDVALAPAAVACAVAPRGLRRAVERTTLACETPRAAPAWHGAIAALRGWLTARRSRGAELRVVLSNHFARYALLPWHPELTTRGEREALARHLLRDKYGEAADAWSVHLGVPAYGQNTLACAIDSALGEAVRSLADEHGLRLASMQSLLGLACDEFAPQLGRDAALFVLEPGRLCCVAVRGGDWHAVQSVRVRPGAWNDAWLARQVDVMGLDPASPRYLADVAAAAGTPRADAPYRLLAARARHGGHLWSLVAGAAT